MHGHSGSIGSFTFTTISALAHTSAALGTSVPPAARYASSANPEPSPAPCSTSTLCPSPTSDSTPAGTSATRCSAVLISLGTPTIMPSPSYVVRRYVVRELVCHDVQRSVVASYIVRLSLSVGPQPDDSLALGIKELRRHARHLFFRKPPHRRQHLIQALVRLAVDRKTGQTIHPGGRTLQGQHQLPLRLLFRLGQRISGESRAGELGVFLADRRRGLRRCLGLRADVHPRDTHLPVE